MIIMAPHVWGKLPSGIYSEGGALNDFNCVGNCIYGKHPMNREQVKMSKYASGQCEEIEMVMYFKHVSQTRL